MDNESEAASVSGISIRTDTDIIERRKCYEIRTMISNYICTMVSKFAFWFRTTCIWRFFEKDTCCTICLGKIYAFLIGEPLKVGRLGL